MSQRSRVLAAAVALLFSATAPLPSRAQPAPYEINVILSTTGPGAFLGKTNEQTLRVVEKTVNASGGIHGRPVRFNVLDDQSNPQVDVQLTSALIAKKVPVVIQGALVASCRAAAPLVANGPVMYCLSPSFYPQPGGYIFVGGTSSFDGTHALLNYFRTRNWKRIAIMTPTDASGQEADQVMTQLFALPENKGQTIVDWEHFAPGDLSVNAQMLKIRDSKPDVVMAWGSGAPVGTEFRAIKDVGITVPVAASIANQTFGQMDQWASILPNELFLYSMKWPAYATIGSGPVKDAMTVMYKAYDAEGLRPDGGTAVSWDPAMILVHVLRTLPDDVTAQQLRDAILQLHGYAGIDGYYDFRGNQRGVGLKDDVVVRWDAGKKSWIPVSASAGAPLANAAMPPPIAGR